MTAQIEKWTDEATGLTCLARNHPSLGSWCGYVGVPEGHANFGKDYDNVSADVHGGLTFGNMISEKDGGVDGLWFLGFDCAHLGDISPGIDCSFDTDATFKDLDFVKEECCKLAAQIL